MKSAEKVLLLLVCGILVILSYPQLCLTDDQAVNETSHYNIVIGVHGNGEAIISGNGVYKQGEIVILQARPASGWVFKSWEGDVESSDHDKDKTSIGINSDKKIIAIFNPEKEQPEHIKPQFRYDSLHTGLSRYEGPGEAIKAWEFPVNDIIDGTPAIDRDGNIYFGVADKHGTIYKLNGKTGYKMLSFQAGEPIFSSPALDSNLTIYIGGLGCHFYAINGFNGKLVWDFETPEGVYSSPCLSKDEKIVFFGCSRKDDNNDPTKNVDKIYALSTATGHIVWQKDFQLKLKHKTYYEWGEFLSSLILNKDKKILYVSNTNGIVYALDPNTGVKIWKFDMGATTWCSPGLGPDGTVYVGESKHYLFALDGFTGALKWKFRAGKSFVSSPAIDSNGNVYCGNHDGNVYALNGKTGEKIWSYQTGMKVEACPVIDNAGRLYVGSKNGILFALNTIDGSLIWSYDCHENETDKHITIYGSVSIGLDRHIYVGTASHGATNKMMAFGPSNSKEKLIPH
jgi:outer membrane protein assembly factor BamB